MKTGKEAVRQQEKKVQEMSEMHPSIIDWCDNQENQIVNKKLFKQQLEMLLNIESWKLVRMRDINEMS